MTAVSNRLAVIFINTPFALVSEPKAHFPYHPLTNEPQTLSSQELYVPCLNLLPSPGKSKGHCSYSFLALVRSKSLCGNRLPFQSYK